VAERLGREAKQMLLSPAVMPMDAYNVEQLPSERLLLCVTSTTGQVGGSCNYHSQCIAYAALPTISARLVEFTLWGACMGYVVCVRGIWGVCVWGVPAMLEDRSSSAS